MAITAKISAAEISAQVDQRFVNKYVEGILIDANGVTYSPGTTVDSTFLGFEVAEANGYERQVLVFQGQDQTAYTDDGVGLATKGTVFTHDGSANAITFTHAALVWGTGNVAALDAATTDPAVGVDGVYTDLPTVTDGSGTGLTVDLTVANNVFVFSPSRFGRNYQTGDSVTILETTMEQAGAVAAGAGLAQMLVGTVSSNTEAGQLITVAPVDTQVTLDAGNEAAFYWDFKLFGFAD
ncbi:MAG: hypothetical protein CMH53_04355 [Myxococcales bacterium]|jgi:hypothetical protein|nr:hypothetical protein [Myxococcales bacterium]|tara:strand:+ start:184 stop:897 length:714 start_codon:yes stop_codon:yes gene_type:complete